MVEMANPGCVNLGGRKALAIQGMCVLLLSHVQLSATPQIVQQAPLSMEFSRQEHWSGLPCPSPGDLPDPGIKTRFLCIAGRFLTI